MKKLLALTSVFVFIFINQAHTQKVEPNHKLLWRITAAHLDQPSYIYGTMHIRDPRVFNFSDSVYVKIEECKHFGMEVHPDSLIKNMIVDPFNSRVNATLEEYINEEEYLEISEELKEKTGLDFDGISKDNIDLIPLFLKKIFKKNKDKNVFLDAHLYHIARLVNRNVVGLETIEDHKMALSTFSSNEKPDIQKIINESKERKKYLNDMIKTYSEGRIEKLFYDSPFQNDSVMVYRNEVMANSSVTYIEDGGVFMAVGAAHLPGEKGMVQLLREKGYHVEPVKATFSKKIINADLANKDLDWVEETYPEDGFSVSIPDRAYNYVPESMAGIVKVRCYPDLGLGHFFFYSVYPIVVEDFELKDLEAEVSQRVSSGFGKFSKKDAKYFSHNGTPVLELKYSLYGTDHIFRYIMKNNLLYTFGVSRMAEGPLDKKLLKKYFNSIKFFDVKKSENTFYADEAGAFKVESNLKPQYFQEVDNSGGITSTINYVNFFDQESKVIHMVSYSYHEAGQVMENSSAALYGYEDNFLTPQDSLVYVKDSLKYGGKEIHIEFSDKTFMKAFIFLRGNRMYQIFNTGASLEKNYEKAQAFINNFDTIAYSDYTVHEFENENFSCAFPSQPKIDTITDEYSLQFFADKSISYSAMDKNSGMNVLVVDNHISPYATYENVDSCFNTFQELYLSYNDTLLHSENNGMADNAVFSLRTQNSNNELDYRLKMIFDNDRLYEVYLIQDSSAVNSLAIDQFLESFKLKNKDVQESLLFRDSSSVKELVYKDIMKKDTSVIKAASSVISSFNFSQDKLKAIAESYKKNYSVEQPEEYHSYMLEFLLDNDVSNLELTIKEIYMDEEVSDDIRISMLSSIVKQNNEESILIAKSLLQEKIPRSENEWDIGSIFMYSYDKYELLKPLFPEIIDLGATDTSFVLDYLFYQFLEEDVIDYEMLSPIHEMVETKSSELFKKIKDGDEDEIYMNKADLMTLAGIRSYSQANDETVEICNYFFEDTLEYYKLEGAKYLLRQGQSPDLSNIYDENTSFNSQLSMYNLERHFDVNVLPDSMQNLSKYAIAASLSYAEDELYFDHPTVSILESIEDETDYQYFILCSYQFEYEDTKERYQILTHAVIDKQEGAFVAPVYNDIYNDYTYVVDDDVAAAMKELKELYKRFLKRQ